MTSKSDRLPGCALIAAGLVTSLMTTLTLADDEVAEVRHFFDSTTDRIPALTSFPEYPSVARRDRIEGEATVCFVIKANGKIYRPTVRSSTHRIFSKPALRAIKNSSFEPLAPGQNVSTAKTCRTYRFRLDPVVEDNHET